MSLHRFIVPPPLAIGIHPAPLPTPKTDSKKQEETDKKINKNDGAEGARADPDDKQKARDTPDEKEKAKTKGENPPAQNQCQPSPGPESPGSMINEPPTPASGAKIPPSPAPTPQADSKPARHSITEEHNVEAVEDAKIKASEGPSEIADGVKGKDDAPRTPEPLRLLSPAPKRPVKARLDLDTSKPYPPINTDSRGAYYQYAKALQNEVIYVDIMKDGWMFDQWRSRSEREALAALRGETEIERRKEIEEEKAKRMKRKVPKTSEAILVELWNDLVKAEYNEIHVHEFWSRYDWSDPSAQVHCRDIRHSVPEQTDSKDGVEGRQEAGTDQHQMDIKKDDAAEVEWTRPGLEEVLGTVGVQCVYNTEKPIPRHWAEPAGAYLIMGHGFFFLRTESSLQWKPEESANKFEILVSSSNDRIFGQMIERQQMEDRKKREMEYRKRKAAEKKAAEEKAAKGAKEAKEKKSGEKGKSSGDKGKENKKEQEKGNEQERDQTKARGDREGQANKMAIGETLDITPQDVLKLVKERILNDQTPGSPGSNVKLQDGEEIKPVPSSPNQDQREIIAVPVAEERREKGDRDAKHDNHVAAVLGDDKAQDDAAPKEDEKVEKKGKEEGEKAKPDNDKVIRKDHVHADKPFDPLREAEKLARMMAGGDGPINMEDIKVAFRALEKAAGESLSGADKTEREKEREKEKEPLIWTWHEPVEEWRVKNYEAGLHNVGPGGWEERDWKVFADDRGCEAFDDDEAWVETLEIDLHDWNC